MNNKKNDQNFMVKLATFIVDKRTGFYLFFIAAIIYSALSVSKTKVNNDITAYLPETTETRQGLTLMEDEFITYGAARIMIANITYEQAEKLAKALEQVEGVSGVTFDDTEDHYKSASALFDISFNGEEDNPVSIDALHQLKEMLSSYDLYVSSSVGADTAASLAQEMQAVLLIAVIIILSVMLFTSKTYMEIPVLLIVFGVAAILNMGTNYWMGTISFVTNSIAIVLQLALAIDYAIIFCHRYTEERENMEARDAVITALSKAIPEISSSSLTTISSLIALMFMQFRIGFDMGMVMTKAILISLLTVFTLMPALLLLFSKWIDRSHHRSFVPNISGLGRFAAKTRYVVPVVFVLLLAGAYILQSRCGYAFGYSKLTTVKKNETQLQEEKITGAFGSDNLLAVLVPVGDYDKEGSLLSSLEKLDKVDSAIGLANITAIDDYVLTDRLTPRQFAELTDLDIEIARLLYTAYAVDKEVYGYLVSGLDDYGVPILDMFMFLYEQKQLGYVNLDNELDEKLDDMYVQLNAGRQQLQGEHYSRLLLHLNLPAEGQETFDYLETIRAAASRYYDDIYLVGDSTSNKDLSSSFNRDNTIISVISALFVMIILLFTFQSAGLPVLLVLTIEGSIWINFSFPYLTDSPMFFLSYLIVSSIQMGATIDYAIVITSRYMSLKKERGDIKLAMTEALNQAFPTIITSGTILASAGILIGMMSSDPAVSSIGTSLGRGTLISIFLVMCVLPQTLLLGDTLIEKTGFVLKSDRPRQSLSGLVRLNGHVRGYVSGAIDANIDGFINGDISAYIEIKNENKENPEEEEAKKNETEE